MKRSVLFIVFISILIVMTSSIAALHPCQGGDPTLHGIVIDGECINCGDNFDGICPEDFGVDCTAHPDDDCIGEVDGGDTFRGYWASDIAGTEITADPHLIDMDVGTTLYMVVQNHDTAQATLTFKVYEDDVTGSNSLNVTGDITASVSGGRAVAAYTVDSMYDLDAEADFGALLHEIYFTVEDGTLPVEESDHLNINATIGLGLSGPQNCGDYTTAQDCGNNTYNVAIYEGDWEYDYDGVSGCDRRQDFVGCEWQLVDTLNALRGGNCLVAPTLFFYPTTNPDNCDESLTSCQYTEEPPIGDCNAGDEAYKIKYVSESGGACKDWTSGPIPCPAKLKLPFFGLYGFFASLLTIALIYAFLIKKESL